MRMKSKVFCNYSLSIYTIRVRVLTNKNFETYPKKIITLSFKPGKNINTYKRVVGILIISFANLPPDYRRAIFQTMQKSYSNSSSRHQHIQNIKPTLWAKVLQIPHATTRYSSISLLNLQREENDYSYKFIVMTDAGRKKRPMN